LDAKDLSVAELVCSRFRVIIEEGKLWAKKCADLWPEISHLVDDIDTSWLESQWKSYKGKRARQQNAACKRLFSSLAAASKPSEYNLICDALGASSADHPQESADKTLSPVVRGRDNVFCYWSSSGSEDDNSDEFLLYRLAHPFCLVSSVSIRPFRAWFQPGNPIYAPKSISVGLGGLHLPNIPAFGTRAYGAGKDPMGAIQHNLKRFLQLETLKIDIEGGSSNTERKENPVDWMTLTKRYPVEQDDRLQTVQLPPHTLCIGGYFQLNLHGRTQIQDADGRYYTCLGRVKAQGRPIKHFRLVNNDPEVLSVGYYYDDDHLSRSYRLELDMRDYLDMFGGLGDVSEGGRCSKDSRAKAALDGLPDPLDDWSGSEIGSDDMDLNVDEFDEIDDDIL
jgi:hypothetical protein